MLVLNTFTHYALFLKEAVHRMRGLIRNQNYSDVMCFLGPLPYHFYHRKNAITNPNRWNGSNLTRPSMLKRSATNPYKVRQPINCEMPGVESPTKLLP